MEIEELTSYIHGFDEHEQKRLLHQAEILAPVVYEGVDFNARFLPVAGPLNSGGDGALQILELGSGVGAQTLQLLNRFPTAAITAVELSGTQIAKAKIILRDAAKRGAVHFVHASAQAVPLADAKFDGAFLCWILEHLNSETGGPELALREVHRLIKPGAPVFIREVFNLLWDVYPVSPVLTHAWHKFNLRQRALGGDPEVGVKLGSMLKQAGFKDIKIKFQNCLYDRRDPAARTQIFHYWQDLFLSGTPDPQDRAQITTEFQKLLVDDNSILFFGFAAAQARK